MKKTLKWIGIAILSGITAWIAVILAANYVFTKTLNLSCEGEQTITIDWNGKESIEKKPKLESLRLEIVTYPFSKTFFFINTADDSFSSFSQSEEINIAHIDEQKIMVGNRWKRDNGYVFKAVTFNRLTKTATIERRTEDTEREKIENKIFEGICKEVVPL